MKKTYFEACCTSSSWFTKQNAAAGLRSFPKLLPQNTCIPQRQFTLPWTPMPLLSQGVLCLTDILSLFFPPKQHTWLGRSFSFDHLQGSLIWTQTNAYVFFGKSMHFPQNQNRIVIHLMPAPASMRRFMIPLLMAGHPPWRTTPQK